MSKMEYSRRSFIKRNSILGLGAAAGIGLSPSVLAGGLSRADTPAILGGSPVRTKGWQKWPMWIPESDEKRLLSVIRSGVWSRAKVVSEFEEKWAATIGAKRCLTLVNGTNSMITSLVQLNIGGGDEVLVPPYTFIATTQAILQTGAIPVFVDTDPSTFQIDVNKIEEKITPRTRAILPVHIAGLPADMERIMAIAKKHDLVVVEDACQAWLAEINHKKVGTFGNAGCFSFQNSKNIPIGEGGAIVSDDEEFMDRCYSYHNYGISHGSTVDLVGAGIAMFGTKLRLTEYQAAIGLAELERLESQTVTRSENATYLRSLIEKIPGIVPYRFTPNVTRAAFHLFPFRYEKSSFSGLSRTGFLKAMHSEGISCSSGYAPLNTMPYIGHAFQTKNFQRMYSKEMLDIDRYNERNRCPENDRLCNEEAVWFTQNMLLGDRSDMDDIFHAMERIQKNAAKIKKSIENA